MISFDQHFYNKMIDCESIFLQQNDQLRIDILITNDQL